MNTSTVLTYLKGLFATIMALLMMLSPYFLYIASKCPSSERQGLHQLPEVYDNGLAPHIGKLYRISLHIVNGKIGSGNGI